MPGIDALLLCTRSVRRVSWLALRAAERRLRSEPHYRRDKRMPRAR